MVKINVSVSGDQDKIEAVKTMGRNAVSDAFKIGLDVYLGQFDDATSTVFNQLIEKNEQVIEHLKSQNLMIKELQNNASRVKITPIQKTPNKIVTKENASIESIVKEYQRCIPLYIKGRNPSLISYLSELVSWTTNADIKNFIANVMNSFDEQNRNIYDINNLDSQLIIDFINKNTEF